MSTEPAWRVSGYCRPDGSDPCGPNNGCVEWLVLPSSVLVRDAKDRDGSAVLVFSRTAFRVFVRDVMAGAV